MPFYRITSIMSNRRQNNFTNLWVFVALVAISLLSAGCNSESALFPSFDYDDQSLAERRLISRGETNLPNIRIFPTAETIKQSQIVKNKMDLAWNKMLESCTPSGRCEYGFCIYMNSNGVIYLGEMQNGPLIPNTQDSRAGINMIIDRDSNDLCAFFHTHTSYYYVSSDYYRPTGPSTEDSIAVLNLNIPGLVYDYTAKHVYGGQPYSNHTVYTYGPSQRPPYVSR